MAVTFTIEVSKDAASRQQLDEVRRLVGATSDEAMPAGMLAHLESETDDGFRIVDVWESPADFERFFAEGLGEAFDKAGFHPMQGPPTTENVISLFLRQRVASYDAMVRELNEAFVRTDMSVFERYVHPDVVDHQEMPGFPSGLEGVRQLSTAMNAAFEGLSAETVDVVSAPGRAACIQRLRGKHVGEFMGIPPTGRRFDVESIDYFAIGDDGLVHEHWGQFDQPGFMAQLGVPAQAGAPSAEHGTTSRT